MKTLVVMRILWKLLCRDRLGLALYGTVPVAFLTIFGLAFGGLSQSSNIQIKIGVLDQDQSPQSHALIAAAHEKSTRMKLEPIAGDDKAHALAAVRSGKYPGAIVIPKGFGKALLGKGAPLPLDFYYDASNPIAPELAQGTLLESASSALGPAFIARRLDDLEKMAGPLTDSQKKLRSQLVEAAEKGTIPKGQSMDSVAAGVLPINAISSSTHRGNRSLVTYYTGAIGIMFLLFSASTICGSLLEERENGLTARLTALGIGAGQMILGRFFFATIIGIVQFVIMLAWAAIIFHVRFFDLSQLVALFLLVPLAAGSAAGLGLILTVPCATRRQQSTVSTIVVLLLSALGGSMVPSFMMPQYLQDLATFTFNWWAIDAFQQVLWYSSMDNGIGATLARIDIALTVLGATSVIGLVFSYSIFRTRS